MRRYESSESGVWCGRNAAVKERRSSARRLSEEGSHGWRNSSECAVSCRCPFDSVGIAKYTRMSSDPARG
jgi:hypothetical protein